MPTDAARNWLRLARTALEAHHTSDAQRFAQEALRIDPDSRDAQQLKHAASWRLRDADGAIAACSRLTELDPQSCRWHRHLGESLALKAALARDRAIRQSLLEEADAHYRRAAGLDPQDVATGLDMLEHQICSERYAEAIGLFGLWWPRVSSPWQRVVCAYLGAMAMILAGRPERRWAPYCQYVQDDRTPLTGWTTFEVDSFLSRLEEATPADLRIKNARSLYERFLLRYER